MKVLLLCLCLATLSSPTLSLSSFPACLQCYHYAEKSLQDLLNVILNIGVVGDCKEICQYLSTPTQQRGCQLYCSKSGIGSFVSAVTNSDNDSIYFCELINQCGFKVDGDAELKLAQLDPSGIAVIFNTVNGTGAGEIQLEVIQADGNVPKALDYPITETGRHEYKIPLNNRDCITKDCLQLPPGKYKIQISVCSCKCGSHHPHSQIYDSKQFTFTVPVIKFSF